MEKKKRKKRLRIGRLFFVLIILGAIGYGIYKYVDVPILSINITGNKILTDNEIIKEADLEDYPNFFLASSSKIKKDSL